MYGIPIKEDNLILKTVVVGKYKMFINFCSRKKFILLKFIKNNITVVKEIEMKKDTHIFCVLKL